MSDHSERPDGGNDLPNPFAMVSDGVAREILAAGIRSGDAVLHLGAGDGEVCLALARLVGAGGSVVGVDADADQVAVSRTRLEGRALPNGHGTLRFLHGLATDLRDDPAAAGRLLPAAGLHSLEALRAFDARRRALAAAEPLIADASVDVVLADLPAVTERATDVPAVLAEIARVLRPGGRCALAGAVLETGSAEDAAEEEALYGMVEAARLEAVRVAFRSATLADEMDGVGIRPLLMTAIKPVGRGPDGPCVEAFYRGPWPEVTLESGERLRRGRRAVVPATLAEGPHARDLMLVGPAPSPGGCC